MTFLILQQRVTSSYQSDTSFEIKCIFMEGIDVMMKVAEKWAIARSPWWINTLQQGVLGVSH